jgi:predicted GNAT family acetyltransferase
VESVLTVTHDESAKQFVVHGDGDDAYIKYALPDAGTIDLQHTFVPQNDRGQGVADALARAAFAYARAQGLRVIPTCPFIQRWLARHKDYQNLT